MKYIITENQNEKLIIKYLNKEYGDLEEYKTDKEPVSLLFVKDGELILDGKFNINISDYNEVYKYLLTPKKFRKKIQTINLNFSYMFGDK